MRYVVVGDEMALPVMSTEDAGRDLRRRQPLMMVTCLYRPSPVAPLPKGLPFDPQRLAELAPRERTILEMRFGVSDGRRYTLRAIGEHFGIGRERVRQIQLAAFAKLGHVADE